MSKPKEGYEIRILLPDTGEKTEKLRKKAIEAFEVLAKEYIRFLSINDNEKKKLYDDIMASIVNHKEIDEN